MSAVQEFEYPEATYEAWRNLQAKGKCGEVQNNGARCNSAISEWFDLDPDRPHPVGDRVGSCRMHAKVVGPRITKLQTFVLGMRTVQFMRHENYRMVRALHAVGIKVEIEERGYRDDVNIRLILENPAEFLKAISDLGLAEKIGLDLQNVLRCESKTQGRKTYSGGETWYQCMEYQGHYPGSKHTDWEHHSWDDPKPEPVRTEGGEGGQFA